MSPREMSDLRYERRGAQVRLVGEISDVDAAALALGLLCRLPVGAQVRLTDELRAFQIYGSTSLPALARQVYGGLGPPEAIDMAQRAREELTP